MRPSPDTIAAIRFGYGFHPRQTPPAGPRDLLDQVEAGVRNPVEGLGGLSLEERAAFMVEFRKLYKANKNDSLRAEMKAVNKKIAGALARDRLLRVTASVRSPYGFFERLAWFWADHFAVAATTRPMRCFAARFEADAIRPHVAGSFRDMLRASSLHPAMLIFLNQNSSMGPNSGPGMNRGKGLNENLAREIIELHTLGVGADYTQADIRQFAELLTGLGTKGADGDYVFRPRFAEPGPETVLGRTYGGDPAEIGDILQALDDLADHPATARHIAIKLTRHFVADDPPEAVVSQVERAFRASRGDLMETYAALLDHEESWTSFGAKVKQPFDFVVSALRATDARRPEAQAFYRLDAGDSRIDKTLKRMNQEVMKPPGPQGWPEEAEAWITPQGLAERIEFASDLGRAVEARLDPRDFVESALGELASDETRFAALRAAERWEGLAFVMASPEFNRR